MSVWLWAALGFLAGSLPFSVWVGRMAGGGDIRKVGDGNPGSMNVGRKLGWRWFLIAMLLDAIKGFIPVGFAYFRGGMDGWQLVPIVLAPVLGHAFSPWLRFRGGKAVAVTFGVWFGLILWNAAIIFGVFLLLMYRMVRVSGWALMLAFGLFGIVVGIIYFPNHPKWAVIWLGNALILAIKHWDDLRQPPGLRPWLAKWLGRV